MGRFGEVQIFLRSAVVLYSVLAAKGVWAQAAGSQAGFISIDCGATSSYVDQATGIFWVPDTNYTSLGVNFINVPGSAAYSTLYPYATTLRYFPGPSKACYELPDTVPNSSYMIRHSYWYGSYDGSNNPPTFKVALDSAQAMAINVSGYTLPASFEIIYKAKKNSITFCLYRDGTNSTPFLSALELRPFKAGAYEQQVLVDGGVLALFLRIDYGGALGKITRFPYDVYDRTWLGWTDDVVITSAVSVDPNNHPLMPPSVVMGTAQTSATPGPIGYLQPFFGMLSDSSCPNCAVNLYFAEIAANSSATSRSFNISVAGFPLVTENIFVDAGGAYKASVKSFYGWTITSASNVTLIPLPTSTNPPLLNAAEVLTAYKLSTSTTNAADVLAVNQIKVALDLTLSSAGDPCLPVPIAWVTCSADSTPRVTAVKLSNYNLTGPIPDAFNSLSALTALWLDHNALTGVIPNFSKLTSLKELHLEYNALSGMIPESLGTLPLIALYLQNNQFIGTVPNSLKRANLLLDVSGNPGINDSSVYSGPSSAPAEPPGSSSGTSGGKKETNIALIAGIVGGIVGAIVLIGGSAVIIWSCRKKQAPKPDANVLPVRDSEEHTTLDSRLVSGAQRYSYADLKTATNGFETKIGSGGFGPVYYGRLSSGMEVAVKVSDINSKQGAHEFRNEVELLSRIHHRNLVSLLGYCEDDEHQMLVYEFLHKGTLQEHLYGSIMATKEPLDFKLRLDIALNAAQGFDYLHQGCNPNIIHRDVKSNNILLTDHYVAKVADFGLSKLGPITTTFHVPTGVKGTLGYLDPEYYISSLLTAKSDVFSFGVVLLEILCARAPIDPNLRDENDRNICNWVRAALQTGDIKKILDPMIVESNMDVLWKVAELAICCVEPQSKHRPSMKDVVSELRVAISMNNSSYSHENSSIFY